MLFCLQLAVAGCAASPPPSPPAIVSGIAHGTILAMRPIVDLASGEVSEVIADLGGPPGLRTTTALCEYILRSDDGRLISVVQPPAAALGPGREVGIVHGDQTRLQPV